MFIWLISTLKIITKTSSLEEGRLLYLHSRLRFLTTENGREQKIQTFEPTHSLFCALVAISVLDAKPKLILQINRHLKLLDVRLLCRFFKWIYGFVTNSAVRCFHITYKFLLTVFSKILKEESCIGWKLHRI